MDSLPRLFHWAKSFFPAVSDLKSQKPDPGEGSRAGKNFNHWRSRLYRLAPRR